MVSRKANAADPSQLSTGATRCMATGLGPRYFFPERGAFSREALIENSFFHGHRGEAGGESQAEDSSFGFLTFNGWLCQTAVLWEGSLPSAPTPGSDGDPEEYLQGQRPQAASQLPLFCKVAPPGCKGSPMPPGGLKQ